MSLWLLWTGAQERLLWVGKWDKLTLESKGTRDHITVNACVLANGLILLPHIIFAGAFSSGPSAREGPDGALYSTSDNGYMDSMLFYVFMDQLFIPKVRHIVCQKLLILDRHGSHLDINTIQLCRANSHSFMLFTAPRDSCISTPWCCNIPSCKVSLFLV